MKKQIFALGLMLAATFTLTNCAKEIEGSVQEPESVAYPFEIVASTVDTKTVNDGMATKWAEGDEINLFHAVGETDEYKNDTPYSNGEGHPFVISDVYNGIFAGELCEPLDPQQVYDWYAFYPYSSYIKTPANISSGYMPVGSKSNEKQTQTGNDNMAHVAGANYPLAGRATAVPAGDTPEITMSHLSSLIAVNVTNNTEENLIVKDVVFTAPVDIVGTYYINFAGEITPDSFKSSGPSYVSSTATLNVENGTALAKGKSAKFYLAVRPFTAAANSTLMLSVNGCQKTFDVANPVEFKAGKIKTLNFAYEEVAEPEPEPEPEQPIGTHTVTISFASTAQRTSLSASEQVWENEDVVLTNSKGSSTNNVADYSNPARFYKSSNISITAPGNITKVEFNSSTGDYLTNLQNSLTGESTNGNSVVMELDGSSNSVTYTLSGGQVRLNTLTVTYVIADPSAPSITAGNVTGVSARGVESAELTYKIDNLEYSDLTVTCDETVVTSASKGADGVINYVVSANATTSARDGSITISNGTVTRNVKVSQLAPVFTVSSNTIELGATADSQTTVTVTSDFDWTLSSEGTGYTVTPNSYTWAGDGKSTVTIQATANRTEEGVADLGTITLVNSTTGQEKTIDVTQATSYESEDNELVSETITGTFTHANKKLSLTTTSGITIVQQIASGSTAVNASYNTATTLRVYKGHSLTFSGKTITKIEIFHSSSYKGNSVTASTGTYTQGSSSSVWTGDSDNVVITNTGAESNVQLRPTKIVVTYKN